MYEGFIKNLESEKRHFKGCAIVALSLMLFMGVSSFMEYAHKEHASMQFIAILSLVFLVIFIALIININKRIDKAKQEAMAKPWIEWHNS
ncbi:MULTISPECIES: hypothetical protein [Acinetobacter]|uniref:Uncharacterized protein n=1 Tax=Acinetobacter indicus TaxID=756892 RepID=A0A6C0Y799_9GAMM|nr:MULTISPECIES: hypothetical protein [Acinetobacter]QIC72121.1 hypothetical protein FSC09_17330 [Acinetobacter indicus]QKQ71477.1 hypothetical protein E5Y90_14695 [Acinetobacter sp. 10FS3-1]